jgi:primosomal protein N' (replication factor Y)
VPIRKKQTQALVIQSALAAQAKSDIKQSRFSLTLLKHITPKGQLPESITKAIHKTAEWHVAPFGATLSALLPASLLRQPGLFQNATHTQNTQNVILHPCILQAEESERIATYKSHIREVFARGGSVFFILPTIQDIERIDAAIGKGIGTYTYVLHSNLTQKQLDERIAEIAASNHSVLVIATPQFVSTPCANVQSIILERESAHAYTLTHRPFIDSRFFVEAYAREQKLTLILGDLFLRSETLLTYQNGEYEALMRPKARYSSTSKSHLIDMRSSGEQPASGKVAFFSKELVSLLSETKKRGASSFILCIRKGIAPVTVCGDCGTVVECAHCGAPLVLHTQKNKQVKQTHHASSLEAPHTPEEEAALGETLHDGVGLSEQDEESSNMFLCHRCGTKAEPHRTCTHCTGWRFTPLGLGIEQAEHILKQKYGEHSVFRIDAESTHSHKEAKERARAFLSAPGSILLGTEMAIPYVTDAIGLVGILSVNSLLTIPEYRMSEHVFRLILVLREKAREHFALQFREKHDMFDLAARGNISEFLEQELALREELHFPPYSLFIKASFEGAKDAIDAFLSYMKEHAHNFEGVHTIFPHTIGKKGLQYSTFVLFVLKRTLWPHESLHAFLASLPPEVVIKVEPKSVLPE